MVNLPAPFRKGGVEVPPFVRGMVEGVRVIEQEYPLGEVVRMVEVEKLSGLQKEGKLEDLRDITVPSDSSCNLYPLYPFYNLYNLYNLLIINYPERRES